MRRHAAKPSRPRTLVAALHHARKVLCCRLHDAMRAPDAAFNGMYALLVAEVESGFRHEELIMGTLGHARLREQQQENAMVLSALHRVLPQVEDGNAALGREVIAALLDVLAMHRLSAGLALAVALQPPPIRMRMRGNAARMTLHVGGRARHPR